MRKRGCSDGVSKVKEPGTELRRPHHHHQSSPHCQRQASAHLTHLRGPCLELHSDSLPKQVNTQGAVCPNSCCTLSFWKEKTNPLPPRGWALFALDFQYLELGGAKSTLNVQGAGWVDTEGSRFHVVPTSPRSAEGSSTTKAPGPAKQRHTCLDPTTSTAALTMYPNHLPQVETEGTDTQNKVASEFHLYS